MENTKQFHKLLKTKKDYAAVILGTILALCIPVIGWMVVYGLSCGFFYSSFGKKKGFLLSILGLVIEALVGFCAIMITFQPFDAPNKTIIYPTTEIAKTEKSLYDDIVNYSGYYLPESYDSYSDDDITFVSLSLKTHALASSYGNKKNSYAYRIKLKTNSDSDRYNIVLVSEEDEVIENHVILKDTYGTVCTDVEEFLTDKNGYICLYRDNVEIYRTKLLTNEPIENYEIAPLFELNTLPGFLKLMLDLDIGILGEIIYVVIILSIDYKKHKEEIIIA